jgi:hypothetical protein
VLFDRFNSTLRDSLAFDGTFIYVVQGVDLFFFFFFFFLFVF